MFEKVSLRLAVLAVLLFAQSQGNPVVETENKDGIQATPTRDPRIGPSDWLHFNHSWSFPSLPSVTGLFTSDDSKEGRTLNLRKRVDALEMTQKSMNEILMNLTRDIAALKESCADKGNGSLVLPGKPAAIIPDSGAGAPSLPDGALSEKPTTSKPEIATGAPSLPDGALSEKPTTSKPGIATGFPSLPEGALPGNPEVTEAPGNDTLIVVPLKTTGNVTPNLQSGGSSAPEIPAKIVIASTSLEENPGENPFGSISLVGFAPSHDSRLNSRMP